MDQIPHLCAVNMILDVGKAANCFESDSPPDYDTVTEMKEKDIELPTYSEAVFHDVERNKSKN